jgi:hypothetical protein
MDLEKLRAMLEERQGQQVALTIKQMDLDVTSAERKLAVEAAVTAKQPAHGRNSTAEAL